ncbi:hypothetical protein [Nostoc sp.]|uniref:hypothetical protein n=1 Tax=Nostoc sp. TaxID=1180 RepID=UPI002FF84568
MDLNEQIKLNIIFPQTAWLNSQMGFSGIETLRRELLKMKQSQEIDFVYLRDYQAILFKIEALNQDLIQNILNLTQEILPPAYQIPIILDKIYLIVSKTEIIICNYDDEKFQKLLQDAHLQLSYQEIPENLSKLDLLEVNQLCDDFGKGDNFCCVLKEFDILKLYESILIDEIFSFKLVGVLIDIKTNYFALEYELLRPYSPGDYKFIETQITKGLLEGSSHRISGLDFDKFFWMHSNLRKNYFRFRRYIHYSNAVVRIRAIWEKLIGLAVLLERPVDFNKVQSAKSVKSEFIKKFENSHNVVTQLIWDYLHSMVIFDEQFRTPELHKTGRIIHWSTQERYEVESNRLLAYRNDLNRVLIRIADLLLKNSNEC